MFEIKNIKASLKIRPILLSSVVNSLEVKNIQVKNSNNFVVFHNIYTYIIFKTCCKNVEHVNITKISCSEKLENSVSHLQFLLSPTIIITTHFQIDNITARFNFQKQINIKKICECLKSEDVKLSFNKEKFPGMFIKFKKGTVILFNSGKSVCVGCNDTLLLQELFTFVKDKVDKYGQL